MSKMKFAFLLSLAPLMMGSDDASQYEALTVNGMLPICQTGEYLTYQGGNLVCAIPASNGVTGVTNCTGQLLTNTGAGGEFKTLSCTAKGGASISSSDITRVTTLSNNVTQLNTTVNNLTAASPSRGYYVGLTAANTGGQMYVAGSDVGIPSGAKLCSSYGPKAHVCTSYEIYASVAAGKNMATLVDAWVYNESWNFTLSQNPAEPDAGLSENCASFVYSSAHLFYAGQTMTYGALPGGGMGLMLKQRGCPSATKAACCN
jgi:hypothetical protein